MKSTEFINESIEDKGICKAIFLAGLPGAGKSTIVSKVNDGQVQPQIINTDRTYEYLLGKNSETASAMAWELFGPKSKLMNASILYNAINSTRAMFVDGTSANSGSLIRRSGLLESLGWDVAMIYVNVDYEVALERIATRVRQVDTDFVQRVYKEMEANKAFYKSKFGSNFIEVDNNSDNFNAAENKTYNIASSFFNSPINNPIGNKNIKTLQKNNEKYLVPTVYSKDYINRVVSTWYTS